MRRMTLALFAATIASCAGLAQSSAAAEGAKPEIPSVEKDLRSSYVSLHGDIRLRLDTINDDSKYDAKNEYYTRDRFLIRARLVAEAKIEDLKTAIGLSTGGANPVSGDQSLGDGFGKKDIRLDLACIEYGFFRDHPCQVKVVAGKMINPILTLPDDLIWDSDLNPEGIAANVIFTNSLMTILLNAEGMWIKERDAHHNAYGLCGQAAVKLTLAENSSLTFGGSCYAFQNIRGYDVIDWSEKNNSYGNSTIPGSISGDTTNNAWAEEFAPIVGFAKCDLLIGLPVSLNVQGVTNPGAGDDNSGYSAGISLGKAVHPNTLACGYSYTMLDKDATLGMFTDGTRWGGGTDGKTSKFYGKYRVSKNLEAAAAFYMGQRKISASGGGSDYNRLQLDLQASF